MFHRNSLNSLEFSQVFFVLVEFYILCFLVSHNFIVFFFICFTYHVSKLLNFFVTTLPKSIPKRSTILWARSGCDVPENTLMFGILECSEFNELADFSKLSRIKLFARIGLADRTGITQSTSTSFYYKKLMQNDKRTNTNANTIHYSLALALTHTHTQNICSLNIIALVNNLPIQ